jgi:predicted ATP-grasp superfamily ATP-dependent carboligase
LNSGIIAGVIERNARSAVLSQEVVEQIINKNNLFRTAEKLGISTPKTIYIERPEHLPLYVNKISPFPVVIKPSLSKVRDGNGYISGGVMYADSQKDLKHLYMSKKILKHPSMIQERIVGSGTGLFTLFDINRHLVLFSHCRIREKPPSGGVSVVSESVPLDYEMVDSAQKLLSKVSWRGVAMVEFKRDERDGKAKLMEINGRFWGTLQLAVTSGVDFPSLYIEYLRGKMRREKVTNYIIGQRLKWLFGTLDHLIIRLKTRDIYLNLPHDAPSRAKSIIDFLRVYDKNTSFDIFDKRDIRPFLFEAKEYIKGLVG